jgi:very-short-patch-repair endonuclease
MAPRGLVLHIRDAVRTGRRSQDAEWEIHSLASRQHGVVSRKQLLAMGMGKGHVLVRLRRRWFRPLHRGVYLVGPVEAPRARAMGAVLSCGEASVIGFHSAAGLWQIMDAPDNPPAVDVIMHPENRRNRPGVRLHRMKLEHDETTVLDDIPVTTPARTLLDLARSTRGRALEQAVAESLARRVADTAAIEAMAKRYHHRPAARRLMALFSGDQRPALTRSAAEEALLALVRKAQLPPPEINVRVHGCEVDLYWRAQRLIVEMDGFAFHRSRHRFDADRRRDATLAAAGLRVMRVTWRQLENEPEALLVRLAQALTRGF